MPLFDFICDNCSHSYEDLVSMRAKSTCPECGGKKTSKQLSLFAAVKNFNPDCAYDRVCDKGPADCGMNTGMG